MPFRKPKTVTAALVAANRRNALKSTGPRTQAGKRRSALYSRDCNLIPPNLESELRAHHGDARDFLGLHRDLLAIFQPHGQAQVRGVELLASLWWEKARRMRVAAGPPRSDDLNVLLETALDFVVRAQQREHAWWRTRLASVIGRPIGSPANVRRRIEARLFVFGAQPGRRPYPRKYRVADQVRDLKKEFGPLLEKIKTLMARVEAEAESIGRTGANEPISISSLLSIG